MAGRATTWRSRIGGRWAVSWQGYLLLAPFAIPLSMLVVPAFFESGTLVVGLLVSTGAYLVAGGVLALASITVLGDRARRPVPAWWIFVIGGVAWLLRSAVFAAYLAWARLPEDTPLRLRLVVGFLLGALLVPGVAWLLATLDEFRSERQRLLGELVSRELQAEESAAYLDLVRRELLAPIEAQVHAAATRLPRTDGPPDPAVALAARSELDSLQEALRHTSRELAPALHEKARDRSRLPVRAVVDATARRPFSLWPIPFFSVIAVLYVSRFTPLGPTVVAVASAGLWSIAVVVVANHLCGRTARPSIPLYAGCVGLMLASGIAAAVVMHLTGEADHASVKLMVTLAVPLTMLMVAGGVAHGVNVAKDAVLTDLHTSISAAEVRRRTLESEESRIRRDIATHLHGTVAANVTAASMRLRQAMDDGDADAAMHALTEARGLLEANLATSSLVDDSDLDRLLDALVDSWRGLVTILVEVEEHGPLPPVLVRTIVDVVTEAVNNAVRHGDAENIDVVLAVDDRTIEVEVRADGHRLEAAGRGLGSDLFDRAAPGAWSLTAGPAGGSVLRVTLLRFR